MSNKYHKFKTSISGDHVFFTCKRPGANRCETMWYITPRDLRLPKNTFSSGAQNDQPCHDLKNHKNPEAQTRQNPKYMISENNLTMHIYYISVSKQSPVTPNDKARPPVEVVSESRASSISGTSTVFRNTRTTTSSTVPTFTIVDVILLPPEALELARLKLKCTVRYGTVHMCIKYTRILANNNSNNNNNNNNNNYYYYYYYYYYY